MKFIRELRSTLQILDIFKSETNIDVNLLKMANGFLRKFEQIKYRGNNNENKNKNYESNT